MNVSKSTGTLVYKALGPMFYVVPWWEIETDNSKISEIHYIRDAIPVFFFLMLIELVSGLIISGVNLYRTRDFYASICQGSVQQISAIYKRGIDAIIYIYLWENFRIVDLTPGTWYEWLLSLLACDLAYYWMHRHAHEYHVFWIGHSVHHSGEDYNLALALRQGIGQAFSSWLWKLPCALVFSPISFFTHLQLNTLYQFWIHTTLVGHLGFLELFLNTPSHHRMHHRPPGNRNYAGVLIIWDRIFGTFEVEDEQKDYYGLAKAVTTFDPIAVNYEHPKRMLKNVGVGKKHDLWFYLSLFTKKRVKHKWVFQPFVLFQGIEKPKANLWKLPQQSKRKKYEGVEPEQSKALKLFVLFEFIIALVVTTYALKDIYPVAAVPWSIKHLASIFLLTSFCCIGRLSDGFYEGVILQTMKTAFFLAIVHFTETLKQLDSNVAHIFEWIHIGEALLWAVTCLGQLASPNQMNAGKED